MFAYLTLAIAAIVVGVLAIGNSTRPAVTR